MQAVSVAGVTLLTPLPGRSFQTPLAMSSVHTVCCGYAETSPARYPSTCWTSTWVIATFVFDQISTRLEYGPALLRHRLSWFSYGGLPLVEVWIGWSRDSLKSFTMSVAGCDVACSQ